MSEYPKWCKTCRNYREGQHPHGALDYQGSLFTPALEVSGMVRDADGLVRSDAPETARAAARLVRRNTGTWRARVFAYILAAGQDGATDYEIETSLGGRPSTTRARRIELVQEGWVVDSGKRRKTVSGAEAIVWIATPEGAREWAKHD